MSYDYSKLSKKQIDESILLLKSNLEDAIKYYTEQKEKVHIDTSLLQVLIQDIIRGKYKFPNELLKIMDLSLIDFSDINITGVDFRDTNANIDPQTVKYKSLDHTNLSGLDMSDKCFDGCSIMYANLSNTSANIDPQTIDEKSLYGANLENLDLSFKCFDDVCIANTNLEGMLILILKLLRKRF